MKKIFSYLIFSAIAFTSNAQENTTSFNKNITPYNDALEKQSGVSSIQFNQAKEWKNFTAKYPNWGCQFNAYTGMPHRAMGSPITFGSGNNLETIAKQFLSSELAAYNIPVSDFVLTSNNNDGKYINVHFKQVHNGLEVLFSNIIVRFTQDKKIILVGVDAYHSIPNLTATISNTQAIANAENSITTQIKNSTVSNNLKIIPIPIDGKMEYKLVYEVTVNTQDTKEMVGKYYTLVDANTGAIVYRENKIVNINTHIQGYVLPKNQWSTKDTLPLKNLEVIVNGITYNTDNNGNINQPNTTPISGTINLQGTWCKIVNGAAGTTSPTFNTTINGNDTITFDTLAASTITTKVNAYYHTNKVHDFLKTKLPAFTGMDNQLLTRVDRTDGNCNAFYDGTAINFYDAGNGCTPTATMADVIYHEYGHGITNTFWQANGLTFNNGAMGEGYSDMWAMSIINFPIIGPGFYTNSATNGIRDYSGAGKYYPTDIIGEVHNDGEIIAGCWWDTYVNWGNLDSTSQLFANSHAGLANGPNGAEGQVYHDILIDALTYDDDDNNINNGTPHFNFITKAFAKHGIFLISDALIAHQPNATSVTPNTNTPINGSVTVSYPAFLGDVKMFYRLKKSGTPAPTDTLIMTPTTGANYTATFAGKNEGDIYEYYFTAYDNSATPIASAYSPISSIFTTTQYQRNLPYYILFGMQSVIKQDFENNVSDWDVVMPNDNATGGRWIIDYPIGSFTNGNIVQTDKDHTTGTGKCAVTGNAINSTLGANTADVDGGRTSLQSPIYDLSLLKNPIVSYWRWFSNSQSTNNPRKDLWKVYISDNGGTSYTLFADKTYQPDVSWRRQLIKLKDLKSNINLSKIRFLFVALDSNINSSGGSGGTWVEAAVDDFEIYDNAYPASINEINLEATIFPNPAKNAVTIEFANTKNNVVFNLVDATGKQIFQQKANHISTYNLNTQNLINGLYFLNIIADDKKSTNKIVVQH